MKLNRWLGLVVVIVLACGFLYWLTTDRLPNQVSEPTAQVLDQGDPTLPPASLKTGSEPERPQEPSELSEREIDSRPLATIPGPSDEFAPEASRTVDSGAAAVEESVQERRIRDAEARRIARKEALEAIEAAVVPPGQRGTIDLQAVLVAPAGGESDVPEMPQRVEPEEPPAEVLEALMRGPSVDPEMDQAIQDARERGASPELKRYMNSGGETGENGELPPELR